jgi:hypothetical protein
MPGPWGAAKCVQDVPPVVETYGGYLKHLAGRFELIRLQWVVPLPVPGESLEILEGLHPNPRTNGELLIIWRHHCFPAA